MKSNEQVQPSYNHLDLPSCTNIASYTLHAIVPGSWKTIRISTEDESSAAVKILTTACERLHVEVPFLNFLHTPRAKGGARLFNETSGYEDRLINPFNKNTASANIQNNSQLCETAS